MTENDSMKDRQSRRMPSSAKVERVPRGERLFDVFRHVWTGRSGEPTQKGTGSLVLQFSDVALLTLTQDLESREIGALVLFLRHAEERDGNAYLEGWNARWLQEHGGYPESTARKTVTALHKAGYVLAEQPRGAQGGFKRAVGFMAAALYGKLTSEPEGPDGRHGSIGFRKTNKRVAAQDPSEPVGGPSVRAPHPNGEHPVDNTVRAPCANGEVPAREGAQTGEVFAQVRTDLHEVPERVIHPPSSSENVDEEEDFFVPLDGRALTRSDLVRFFAQPRLASQVGGSWETLVALVARQFASHEGRSASLLGWLGMLSEQDSRDALAALLVDLVRHHGTARDEAALPVQARLRAQGVRRVPSGSGEFTAMFVVSVSAGISGSRPVDNWAGWLGAGLNTDTVIASRPVLEILGVLTAALRSAADLAALVSEGEVTRRNQMRELDVATPPVSESGHPSGEAYEAELQAAAVWAGWADELNLNMLRRNKTMAARIIDRYRAAKRSGEADSKIG